MVAFLQTILPAAQILVAGLLITAILFQPSTAGVGGAISGGDNAHNFHTKRGFEKFLFLATIVLTVLFATLCVLAIVL
jgi:protein translocase SecG subunit